MEVEEEVRVTGSPVLRGRGAGGVIAMLVCVLCSMFPQAVRGVLVKYTF